MVHTSMDDYGIRTRDQEVWVCQGREVNVVFVLYYGEYRRMRNRLVDFEKEGSSYCSYRAVYVMGNWRLR